MANRPGSQRRAWADGQNFVRTRPIKCKFGLKDLGVRVGLHTLADGGGGVVQPSPTTHDELGRRAQRVGKGGVSAVNAGNGEGMVFTDNVVRSLLPVGGQVAISQVVAGQTLMSRYPFAFENRQRKARKPTHVNLVGR